MKLPLWIKEIKWFIQRGKRGYADCDWWNLDSHICKIVIGGIDDIMYQGSHVGCIGKGWDEWPLNDPNARRVHNLYRRIKRFFEIHQMYMDDPRWYDNKELRRQYKASGLLFIRNFKRLWD